MIGRKLYLSDKDRKIAGVCGGLAEYFGIDSTIVRILWALAVMVSYGTGFILYLVILAYRSTRKKYTSLKTAMIRVE